MCAVLDAVLWVLGVCISTSMPGYNSSLEKKVKCHTVNSTQLGIEQKKSKNCNENDVIHRLCASIYCYIQYVR